jgi:hypothetical protein
MTTLQLKNQLFGTTYNAKSSYYVDFNGICVRVSDHLPQSHNIKNNHEEGEKIFFLFTDCELTDFQIQKHLESILKNDYQYDYAIFENGDDLEMIKRYIARL